MQNAFQPDIYIVMKGDTLYSIAWRYQIDHEDLIRWNQIPEPFTIYPDDRVALSAQAASSSRRGTISTALLQPVEAAPSRPLARPGSPPVATKPQQEPPTTTVTPATETARPVIVQKKPNPSSAVVVPVDGTKSPQPGDWLWPTSGQVINYFIEGDKAKQGLDIKGQYGQTVLASAPGTVVYSGSGLASYGKLIIVKHDANFLSAYAYNSKLLVQEGDKVHRGQQIAAMGRNGDRDVILHFEIRRNGKPTNPMWYLKR